MLTPRSGLSAHAAQRVPLVIGTFVVMAAVSLAAQVRVQRQELLARAQVWRPTDVASKNMRAGDGGPGAFVPGEVVHCDYVDRDLHGRSPKFRCRLPPDDEVKVKFGRENGEVYAEVVATRLLWALGFGADRMYPVRVLCRGCPNAIGEQGVNGERIVDPATIERRYDRELAAADGRAWSWAELDLIDERAGGATRAQRDALKLLAVFLQHTDTKPEQQRLLCLDIQADAGGHCVQPFLMLNDVGLTFGRATLVNSNDVSGMNHREWANTPVWKYATTCIGNLPRSLTGTLRDPIISEEGRRFLAGLLMQLSDAQLRDLFEVARVEQRVPGPAGGGATATVQQWVDTFKEKRAAIVDRRCTDGWSTRASMLFTTTPNLWLQSWASPRLTEGMDVISLFGYTPFYALLATLLAFTLNVRAGASLLVLLVLTNVITDAAKVVVSYPRPDAVDERIATLGPSWQRAEANRTGSNHTGTIVRYMPRAAQEVVAHVAALPSTVDADDAYGFPSGHVAVATAFLCGLVFLFGWRQAWIAALIWIPLMGLSRMYLGRHFIGDVIGGVAAGVLATVVAVRAWNLQRLRPGRDMRVLLKTCATAGACAALAFLASIPPVYEAGRLAGAVAALVLVTGTAPPGYDDASRMIRIGRLGVAMVCAGLVWWGTIAALRANAGEPSATQAFLIGGVRMSVFIAAPILLERALRRTAWKTAAARRIREVRNP